MKTRPGIALALTAMIGSTAFLAANALAQQQNPPARPGQTQGPRAASPEDRGAFFDARIAAVKAGLKLTAEQEALWPPAEAAVREGFAKRAEMRAKMQAQGRPADPVDGMRRMADASTARGELMRKIVDAAQPLYASLSDAQKSRLTVLMHPPRSRIAQMRDHFRGMWNGDRGRDDRRGMGRPDMDPRGMGPQGMDPRGMGPRGGERSGPRGPRGDDGRL